MENREYEELIKECKDYTIPRLNRNIIFLRFLIFFLNPIAMWLCDIFIWAIIWGVFTMVGFLDFSILTVTLFFVLHFVYWEFFQKKNSKELIDDIGGIDLNNAIKALKEVKEEKTKK